jgi:pentatricopeptide repeat protein
MIRRVLQNPSPSGMLQEVKESELRIDVALLSALIAALGSEGMAEEALAVFRRMVRAMWDSDGHPQQLTL